jgi:hypothetical protein
MRKKLPAKALEYFRKQGAKGGKIGAMRRMEILTAAQRTEIAKKAAAARWATVTQADLKVQSGLQAAEWAADRAAQMGAEDIGARLADGATMNPGKLTFDRKLKMAMQPKSKKKTTRKSNE